MSERETCRVGLWRYDQAGAMYRTNGEADPIHQFVVVQIDPDRFKAMGKPGYLDVTVALPDPDQS